LHVAAPVPVERMEAIAGTSYLPEPIRTRVVGNLTRLGSTTWLRCSAHEYRTAAAGFCHALFYNRLMPWDHAPGWLIHQEAGGYSAHFDGTPYLPTQTTGGLICAPDQASWQAMRDALLGDS
jgi:fructose-1,6-bisphosphatase/inositol monophosphatase family enzyme